MSMTILLILALSFLDHVTGNTDIKGLLFLSLMCIIWDIATLGFRFGKRTP